MDGIDAAEVLATALGQMAAFRGATVTDETLALFAARLVAERVRVEDAVEACRRLEREERAEGELAFPSLGTLLKRIGLVESQRYRREQERREHGVKQLQAQRDADLPHFTKAEAKAFVAQMRQDVEAVRKGMKRRAS